ncbi:OB-fold domain-containing protein [Mycolicibacterium hippocampi]|uniref:Zn-ribbon domain-containing OB-fold protein n=1 Tax=Mycobacteriaceae TaxID=1762 RepID=UPI0015B70EF9|nr:OB-fold domain-containing protein [Mycolicibacterium hippocampi]
MRVPRCVRCSLWVSPPAPDCPDCGGELTPEPVSGRGSVFTYTVNHHAFDPTIPVPYIIAVIGLDEQHDLRIVANIVDCQTDSVSIGMRVAARGTADTPVFVPA